MQHLDQSLYPRTYRYSDRSKSVGLRFTFVLILLTIATYIYRHSDTPEFYLNKDSAVVVGFFLFCMAVFTLAYSFGTWFRLNLNSIEFSFCLFKKTFPREEMTLRSGFFDKKAIFLTHLPSGNRLDLPVQDLNKYFDVDDAFNNWWATLPDYKTVLTQQRKELVAKRKLWFASPASGLLKYHLTRFFLQHVPLIAILYIFFSGTFLFHVPSITPSYALILYAAMLVGPVLYLSAPDIFTLSGPWDEKVKISLFFLFLFPGIFAGWWLFSSSFYTEGINADLFNGDYWHRNPIFLAIFLSLLAVPWLHSKPKTILQGLERTLSYGLPILPCAAGLMISYDILFDKTLPRIFETNITQKVPLDEDHPRTAFRYLYVEPWDTAIPKAPPNFEIAVSAKFYDQLHAGDIICVYQYAGTLGIPWSKAHNCPQIIND